MKKEFRLVDEARGIVQVTTDDERFYVRESKDEITGNPCHIWLPSATWITSFVPKGIQYYKWLADKGWNESEAIKTERGKYGSRVHKAVEALLNGEDIKIDTVLIDPYTGQLESLTFEEYCAVLSFKNWWVELNKDHKVEVIAVEETLWSEELGAAGTLDLLIKIDGVLWIIDFKTSQYIWASHEAQLSFYRHAVKAPELPKIAILQLGYKRNKNEYKFTELEDKIDQFNAARVFWKEEHSGTKPFQKDVPILISLGLKKNMSETVLPTIQVDETPDLPVEATPVEKKIKKTKKTN